MSESALPPIVYTRNGFVGPFTIVQKPTYPVEYKSAEGPYAPRRFDLNAVSDSFDDQRPMPIAVLEEAGTARLSMEAFNLRGSMPFALRNVFADELHVIYSGAASLQTELGLMDVAAGDLVLIPRAISYRIADVQGDYKSLIAASETPWSLAMTPGNGPLQRVHHPVAWPEAPPAFGRHEVILRHGGERTSLFYDRDPLPGRYLAGPQPLYKINMNEVGHVQLIGGAGMLLPDALLHDQTTCNLVFNLSSRKTDRPDVHYNADYDELVFYLGGEGSWGALSEPGMLTHTPKGFPHQGPDEEVPAGYKAILVETRCKMRPTAIGMTLGQLVVADQYELHRPELVSS